MKHSDGSNDQPEYLESEQGLSRRMVAGSFAALAASIAAATASRAGTSVNAQKPYSPSQGTDYATTDIPYYDPDYPPMHFPHAFMSKGTPVQSFMWLASGPEPKGCVILSPQAYGGDCLDSLVPALVGAGIHVMRFNPRGMWDDQQDYSFSGALDDLHSAIAFLRENGGQHVVPPGTGRPRAFQIDMDCIAVLGKSGGGGMIGWVAASENPDLNSVISVAPAMMAHPPLPSEQEKFFADLKTSSAGRIDINKWVALSQKDYDRLSMLKAATKLVDKNVLLIGESRREYLEQTHQPLVRSMKNAGAKHFSHVILEADSYFLTVRIALARLVVSWLRDQCGF